MDTEQCSRKAKKINVIEMTNDIAGMNKMDFQFSKFHYLGPKCHF